jgi:hypothetical protein
MSTLLKDCKAGLQQAFDFFQVGSRMPFRHFTEKFNMQIKNINIITDVEMMQQIAQKRHWDVLEMIEALSDDTTSDGASTV